MEPVGLALWYEVYPDDPERAEWYAPDAERRIDDAIARVEDVPRYRRSQFDSGKPKRCLTHVAERRMIVGQDRDKGPVAERMLSLRCHRDNPAELPTHCISLS
jgi:hypothetical protein